MKASGVSVEAAACAKPAIANENVGGLCGAVKDEGYRIFTISGHCRNAGRKNPDSIKPSGKTKGEQGLKAR